MLLVLSVAILLGCTGIATQVRGMPGSFWAVVGLFALLGVAGLGAALFGSDRLVAMVLGSV